MSHLRAALIGFIVAMSAAAEPPAETPEQAKARHARVAERRQHVDIICHRGSSEFAHENTLEAFRASFVLGAATEKLCRDHLALSDAEARKIGPPQFEAAGKALLAVSPKTDTALELMKHRLQEVRGRAILDCLAHAKEPWALAALERGAPALAGRVGQ